MASDPSDTPATAPTSSAPSKLHPGQVIDGFELIERVHQGGMAALWSVRQLTPLPSASGDLPEAFPMLMKVPRIKGGEDPATIVGFEVERMLMPRLTGPHVPRFVARGDFTQQPYIVMERIDGVSMKSHFDRAPLPVEEVARLGVAVAQALHSLHEQHVVHLDIKPSNVMLKPDGTAVLVDFGLSRHDHLPDLLEEEFTLPMGTGPYMSPEQVQFVRSDPRSDLFALGVMLYALATGARPFGQPHSMAGLRKRLYTEPVPPCTLQPTLPAWFQEIVLRCMEVHVEQRYPTAAQLMFDLQHPEQVVLTERAERKKAAGRFRTFQRWFKAIGTEPEVHASAEDQIDRSPIIMVAADVTGQTPELAAKLLRTVQRLLQIEQRARLACVSVMKTHRIGMDTLTDAKGNSLHVQQLVALKHWARPLQQAFAMDDQRLTFHVLEAPDAASALVEFANKNEVAHIVMGARANSALRRYLGSVSARVVAEAECSVTVVRV